MPCAIAMGVIGVNSHDQGAGRRRNTGGDKDSVLVHSGGGQDVRIDENNIGHGQKGRQARKQLGFYGCVIFVQMKQRIKHGIPLPRCSLFSLLVRIGGNQGRAGGID